jgi:hypothetical protein
VGKNGFIIGMLVGIVLGIISTAIAARGFYTRGPSGESQSLSERSSELARAERDRQVRINENQRELIGIVDECIDAAERTRAITERSGERSGRAIENLREAVSFIDQGIEEREAFKVEHDNLLAGLYRLRDMARALDE